MAAHDYNVMSDAAVTGFFTGQHPDAQLTGWKLADAEDFSTVRHVVDVGGGSGGISIALCERFPDLRATVVELPAIARVAASYKERSTARDRLDTVTADLLESPLTGKYDAAVLRSLLQVLGPSDCETVLRNVRPGLAPGAKLYIIGQIIDDDRLNPENVALFNLVFLSFYEQGRAHTEADHRKWLQAAGFLDIERKMTPNGLNMITARAPA